MRPHVVQRAYQLAKSGGHRDVKSITVALKAEGYDGRDLAHLREAPALRAQLAAECRARRVDA